MVAQAFQQRPELAGLRLERESAYRFERAERDLSLPTVSLIGVGGFLPYIHQLTTQTVPPEYESAAVNVEIPIFNGGLFTARREAARFKAQAADQRVRDLEESVARDVRVAWSPRSYSGKLPWRSTWRKGAITWDSARSWSYRRRS